MPTVEEAAGKFADDLKSQNIAGLMLVFTPEAMMKALTMQGQLQARAMQAQAAGQTPGQITGYQLDPKGVDGEDEVVHITMESTDGNAEIMTRWREIEGAWKVTDLSLVGATNADGSPATL